jgi:S1-C subfamily serine protease
MFGNPSFQNRPPRANVLTNLFGLMLVLLILLGVGIWWRFGSRGPAALNPDAPMAPVQARGDLAGIEKTTIAIFRRNSPSVVHITTLVNAATDDFGFDVQEVPQGTGSGFVWDKQGRIVTNYHVIHGADVAQVVLADHSTWKAHLVGAFPEGDLAVLAIDAPADRLQPIQVGASHDLQVGQSVFAIGNPFGLDHTLTTGIVSALGRQISSESGKTVKGMIQIDAPINPGNSGGPLLDSSGLLIGVNSAIVSPSGAFAGIGFAIPVDKVNRVVTDLIRHGRILRPSLGVEPAPEQWTEELGLSGVLVLSVTPGGPAAKAGIRGIHQLPNGEIELGDLILAINGETLQSSDDLASVQDKYKIGDTVTVQLLRGNRRREVKVVLAVPK